MAISQQFQKDWERCVDASYQVTQQQTADKNAAPFAAVDTRHWDRPLPDWEAVEKLARPRREKHLGFRKLLQDDAI